MAATQAPAGPSDLGRISSNSGSGAPSRSKRGSAGTRDTRERDPTSRHPCVGWKRTARRARLAGARTRANASKVVMMSGVEFVKGFARKSDALTALVVCVVVIAYGGVGPADAVRHVLGM